jgi:hypothetical protein
VDAFPRQILEWQRATVLLACAMRYRTPGPASWFSRGELARLGRGSAASVAAAIDHLVLGGYLKAAGSRYRARALEAPTPLAATNTPFPLRRRLAFIRKHAARMAAVPSKPQADAHLRQQDGCVEAAGAPRDDRPAKVESDR